MLVILVVLVFLTGTHSKYTAVALGERVASQDCFHFGTEEAAK